MQSRVLLLFKLLKSVELLLQIENETQALIEHLPLKSFVVDAAVVLGYSVMDRAVDVYHLVLLIKGQYFVAVFVFQDGPAVVDVPETAEQAIQFEYILILRKPIKDNLVEEPHGPVSNKALDDPRKLRNQM
jgi:hypothetical protein